MITLMIDSKHMGVGGDDSWTPMSVHPKYRVQLSPSLPSDWGFFSLSINGL